MRSQRLVPLVLGVTAILALTASAPSPAVALAQPARTEAVGADARSTSALATGAEATIAQQVASHINAERTARGLRTLAFSSSSTAQSTARHNADSGCRACHSGSLPPNGGEVAFSSGPESRAGAATVWWMGSSGHRALLLDTGISQIGVGVACASDGHFEVIAQVWSISGATRDDGRGPVTSSGSGSSCGSAAAAPSPPPAPSPAAPAPPAGRAPPAPASTPSPPTTEPADRDRIVAALSISATLWRQPATRNRRVLAAVPAPLAPRPRPPAPTEAQGGAPVATTLVVLAGAAVLTPGVVTARRRRRGAVRLR